MRWRDRAILLSIGALVGVRLFVVAAALDAPPVYERGSLYRYDASRYHHVAQTDGVPWRDVVVPFPPVAVGFIELVGGPSVRDTMHRLAWAALALDLLVAVGLAYGWGRRAATAYLVLGLPLLLTPAIYYFRIDLLAVALAIWGLALVKRRNAAGGGVVLALAVLSKMWPVGIAPVMLVRRRGRALAGFAATASLAVISWVAWVGTTGPRQVLELGGAEGWQIESIVGGAIRAITGSAAVRDAGAVRTGSIPDGVTLVLGAVLVAIVVATWSGVAKTADASDGVVSGVAPLVATAAFLACAPVLSPQYVTWLLPFAAVCWAARHRALAIGVGTIVVLTALVADDYHALVAGSAWSQTMLTVRNLLIVATIAGGMRSIYRRREQGPSAADAIEPEDRVREVGVARAT